MGITELKTFQISCDYCQHQGPTIMSQHRPSIPRDWSYAHQHDCGMTGYTRTIVLCEQCTIMAAEKGEKQVEGEKSNT